MKNLIAVIACISLLSGTHLSSFGQSQTICGIWFEYDAVGNRVKRYYDCKDDQEQSDKPEDEYYTMRTTSTDSTSSERVRNKKNSQQKVQKAWTDNSEPTTNAFGVLVYPNPTAGEFHIRLEKMPEQKIHFHWYNDVGQILSSGDFYGLLYTGAMGNWPTGVYWLRLYAGDQMLGSWKILKQSTGN